MSEYSTVESKEQNRRMINAYEKMLKDGTAFKEVDVTMHTEPNIAEIDGLGDRINEQPKEVNLEERRNSDSFIDENTDYSDFDDHMQQRINSLRNKMGKGKKQTNERVSNNTEKEIAILKRRIKKIEEAMMLIMETHEKILGE